MVNQVPWILDNSIIVRLPLLFKYIMFKTSRVYVLDNGTFIVLSEYIEYMLCI